MHTMATLTTNDGVEIRIDLRLAIGVRDTKLGAVIGHLRVDAAGFDGLLGLVEIDPFRSLSNPL